MAELGLHCCMAFLWLWQTGDILHCRSWASHCSGPFNKKFLSMSFVFTTTEDSRVQ